MGARLPWEQEVLGSTPRRPTQCNYGSRGLVARRITEIQSSDKRVALRSIRRATTEPEMRNHVRALETHAT